VSDYEPGTVALVTLNGVRLVCLELTREDADLLSILGNTGDGHQQAKGICRGIAAAIREQTPEPEPPKRWTVDFDPTKFGTQVLDNGTTALTVWKGTNAQAIADLLNAAEPKP
jgi:hypothetical protein